MSTISLPAFPWHGGCQCGAVRFRLKAAPIVFYLCHCSTCQQQSSSAFGESVKVKASDVEIDGEMAAFTARADSGNAKLCEFCPRCGTRLFHGRTPGADTLNMKGGTFDDRSWLMPAGHIWTASKQPFVIIGADELSYDKAGDYPALTARWRQMIGAES